MGWMDEWSSPVFPPADNAERSQCHSFWLPDPRGASFHTGKLLADVWVRWVKFRIRHSYCLFFLKAFDFSPPDCFLLVQNRQLDFSSLWIPRLISPNWGFPTRRQAPGTSACAPCVPPNMGETGRPASLFLRTFPLCLHLTSMETCTLLFFIKEIIASFWMFIKETFNSLVSVFCVGSGVSSAFFLFPVFMLS